MARGSKKPSDRAEHLEPGDLVLEGLFAKAWARTQGKDIPLTLGIGGPRIGTVTAVSEKDGEVIVAARIDLDEEGPR